MAKKLSRRERKALGPLIQPALRSATPDVRPSPLVVPDTSGDWVNRYFLERDPLCQRAMLLDIVRRTSAFQRLLISLADDVSSREVVITPTETSPSATTMAQMSAASERIAIAQYKPSGWRDFIINFLEGYLASKTGTFILSGLGEDSAGLSALKADAPQPMFGLDENFVPLLGPSLEYPMPTGIWWVDGVFGFQRAYYALYGDYRQEAWGAPGFAAFNYCQPPAERIISDIVTSFILETYARQTLNATDLQQLVIWNNIAYSTVDAYAKQNDEAIDLLKRGNDVDPSKRRGRHHFFNENPDTPAAVQLVDLRAFPKDFDVVRWLNFYDEKIALGMGVTPRRIAPDSQRERFGNAAQAAMLNGDEPGMRDIVSTIERHLNTTLLANVAARATLISKSSADRYAQMSIDSMAINNAQQLANITGSPDNAIAYLDRAIEMPQGSQGKIVVSDGPVVKALPAPMVIVHRSLKEVADECTVRAMQLYDDWVKSDLPQFEDRFGVDMRELERDVNHISNEVAGLIVRCSQRHAGNSRDRRVTQYYDLLRHGLYNRWGAPSLRDRSYHVPKVTLFGALSDVARQITLRRATMQDLVKAAEGFAFDIPRYVNGGTASQYIREFTVDGYEGAVEWVTSEDEKECPDCRSFGGRYDSMQAMLRRTGGRFPRSIDLKCSGNCRCELRKA